MRLLHSPHSWHYRQGSDPTVDFCLWTLEVDGLHVSPFDQHPEGDGSLRALGLTEESWQTWFLRTLDPVQSQQDREQMRQRHLAEYLKIAGVPNQEDLKRRYQAEQLKIATDPPLPPPPDVFYHVASWTGSAAVKERLIELEKQYRQICQQRNRWRDEVERALHREERKAATRLYDELQPYHRRIASLNIYFVTYESPLDYLVAPATLLITVQQGQPGPQEFRERVLAAAAELAARSERRKRPAVYTRKEGSTDQWLAYRRHERRPVSLAIPAPEVPRLEDPLRQMVIEELASNRVFDGAIDFTTVQFLREKHRPGWKLYEVTFQETDGEQHRMLAILQQTENGSWHWNGGGSSSDMQKHWTKVVAPVRDHPLLFLAWQGFAIDNQQYLHVAHGDVIDNGFGIERVRLVNDAGQMLEDVVENGYVFFACQLEEQVQLPMQAELYDRQGKLVWRQKFPDQGLPPWLKLKHQR